MNNSILSNRSDFIAVASCPFKNYETKLLGNSNGRAKLSNNSTPRFLFHKKWLTPETYLEVEIPETLLCSSKNLYWKGRGGEIYYSQHCFASNLLLTNAIYSGEGCLRPPNFTPKVNCLRVPFVIVKWLFTVAIVQPRTEGETIPLIVWRDNWFVLTPDPLMPLVNQFSSSIKLIVRMNIDEASRIFSIKMKRAREIWVYDARVYQI